MFWESQPLGHVFIVLLLLLLLLCFLHGVWLPFSVIEGNSPLKVTADCFLWHGPPASDLTVQAGMACCRPWTCNHGTRISSYTSLNLKNGYMQMGKAVHRPQIAVSRTSLNLKKPAKGAVTRDARPKTAYVRKKVDLSSQRRHGPGTLGRRFGLCLGVGFWRIHLGQVK